MRALTSLLGLAMLGTALTLSAPARTQTDRPAPNGAAERAITAGRAGIAAYEQGKWSEALEQFRRAEALYHSPVLALFAARSLRQLGQLLEARTALLKLAEESIAPAAPATWQKVPADTRLELAELADEIPTVTLLVAANERSAQLTLDGAPATAEQAIELNPGQHRATVTSGTRQRELHFNVAPRAHARLTLSLGSPSSAAPRAPSGAAPRHGALYVPGWILAGTGALALASGGVAGALALNQRATLRDSLEKTVPAGSCRQHTCLRSQQAAIDSHFEPARQFAVASDVLWISGSVLAAVGFTLILVDRGPVDRVATLRLGLAPGGSSLDLTF